MVWLTPDDLKSMGASMLGKPDQLAVEQKQKPMQLHQDIEPKTRANVPAATWAALVDKAITLSSSQNNGKIDSGRVCQPEFKTCVNAVWFKVGEKQMFVKVTKNLSDKIIRRELCELNSYRDIRTCLDWDTNVTNKSMKNSDGKWIGID